MYVCVRKRMYVHLQMCTRIYKRTKDARPRLLRDECACTCVCVCVRVCVRACVCRVRVCMYTSARVHLDAYTRVCALARVRLGAFAEYTWG